MLLEEDDVHIPPLNAGHLIDAKLFACREDMVRGLFRHGAETVCEIGVAFGDFSEFLISVLKPSCFYAVDVFGLHHEKTVWGRDTAQTFGNRTHRTFYHDRIAPLVPKLEIFEGLSQTTVPNLPDKSFDMIYIDAGHQYENAKSDGTISLQKIKPSGTIIFNDYVLFDPFMSCSYGVVRAVNELVSSSDWKIIGFALQTHMFCDIALRRCDGQS